MSLLDKCFERSCADSFFGPVADSAEGSEEIRIAFSGVLHPLLGFKRSDVKFSDRVYFKKLAFFSNSIKYTSPSSL